ncbi:hypothetical protein ACFSHT_21450 [Paraburkholderia silviterrae]|uniref:hypothetical protein n=1 Tax=Paraburkholderia silviterrae TaxID=2528715 RepID=UPI001404A9CB|nr:hypothetical protein [Paraburkholderia silviterrae]
MNTLTKRFKDAQRHLSARLTEHLEIWIGALGDNELAVPPVLSNSDLTINCLRSHTD